MRVRLAIGDFARMTHLSVKALRHYHDVGLLTPAEIDPVSGYRFYEPSQLPTAQVIRRFRDLGMPLEEIKEVLQAPDVAARNEVIVAHLQRMESQLAATQSVVASLRSLLERPPAPIAVEHRSVGPVRALAIRGQVSMPELDAWLDAAQRELDAALAAAGAPAAGPRGALYPAELFELGAGQVVAYVPVTGRYRPAPGPACWRSLPPSWPWPCTGAPWPTWTSPTARWAPTWPSARSAWTGRSASTTWSRRSTPMTRPVT
jgi:DNA-binding transcriptional MerR regulator